MDAMTQMEVFALIGEINDFADRSESLINRTRTSYEQNKSKYLELKNKYENHPLVVNFNVMQEEVGYLLKNLENKLKI